MAHNKEYSLYYKSTNPNLPQVTSLVDQLHQWDGSSSMPPEIFRSEGAMPPSWTKGDYIVWSDTYTLGYTDEANAAPIYYTDLGLGDARILRVINHVAKRVGVSAFSNVVDAKTWAQNHPKIYVAVAAEDNGDVCTLYEITTTTTSTISYIPCGSPTDTVETITVLQAINGGSAVDFSGNQSYPAIQPVNLGQSVGTTTMNFQAYNVPDRFVIHYNGAIALDTGYRGSSSYNYGGSSRAAFNNSLRGKVDPVSGATYPLSNITPGVEIDGYPTVTSPGQGNASFNKNLPNITSAQIKVYAPMGGTAWNLTLGLPNGESSPVGGGSQTIIISSENLPVVTSGSATITKL